MPPAQVAALVVDAIRTGAPYLLTDHNWDDRIIQRHQAILAGAVGPVGPVGPLAAAALHENGAADG
jgi:hypothetical protein